ncbi:MAG TPA: YhjD/YihY/BrkB family envelope integrity protein [Solirubrobacteraceae bacterium]|nr:YhjD/YihY/BrkB family envelope integrity protein [Solirubrobacteraceae bacterium]
MLRVVSRFQKVAGFDRSIALSSSALTALIPLSIIAGALVPNRNQQDAAERVIDRYDLSGGGAEAVREILAPTADTSTSIGLLGAFFLLLALLSFTRAMQRLFEQTWELKPLSVRNSLNGLLWIGGLTIYAAATSLLHTRGDTPLELPATLATVPITAIFLVWTGSVLSAKRLQRADLLPFAVLGAALNGVYAIGAQVYVPHLFDTYATRYGVIGAVFAMISTLFCVAVILVGSAAVGREVHVELQRIRSGERIPEDEVRRQWAEVTSEARSRWQRLRGWRRDRGAVGE